VYIHAKTTCLASLYTHILNIFKVYSKLAKFSIIYHFCRTTLLQYVLNDIGILSDRPLVFVSLRPSLRQLYLNREGK